MSRPSHLLLLWFLVLGLGMWMTGAMNSLFEGPVAAKEAPARASKVLRHSSRSGPELPPIAVLSGRVIDRLGWPVAGARIETAAMLGSVDSASGVDAASGPAVSDEEGYFSLQVRGARQHLLSAVAKGKGVGRAKALPGEPAVLVLLPDYPWQALAGKSLTGKSLTGKSLTGNEPRAEILLAGVGGLVDPEGRELPKAMVLVRETGESVQADEFGLFQLPLPTSDCSILAYDTEGRVGAMEFKPGRVGAMEFNPGRSLRLLPLGEIVLDFGIDLKGILYDAQNARAPLATMQLSRDGMERRSCTDESGRFSFLGLLPGEYELIAYPHRGDLGFRETITLDRGMDADWTLRASHSMRIQVLDGAAAPQPMVHVVADQLVADQDGWGSCYAQSDDEGYVVFEGLGAGPYAFEVRDRDLDQLEVIGYEAEVAKLRVTAAASPKER